MSIEEIKKIKFPTNIEHDLDKLGLDGNKLMEVWNYLVKQAEKTEKYENALKEIASLNECDPAYRIALFASRTLK